jgi:hypothetical protein
MRSVGKVRYSLEPLLKATLDVDPGIVAFYRSLVPKSIRLNSQMYAPHISFVRKEIPPNMDVWGKYEGEEIEFEYSNIIHFDDVYAWLDVHSLRLQEIRMELGLPHMRRHSGSPDGFSQSFHITIGNFKSENPK